MSDKPECVIIAPHFDDEIIGGYELLINPLIKPIIVYMQDDEERKKALRYFELAVNADEKSRTAKFDLEVTQKKITFLEEMNKKMDNMPPRSGGGAGKKTPSSDHGRVRGMDNGTEEHIVRGLFLRRRAGIPEVRQ